MSGTEHSLYSLGSTTTGSNSSSSSSSRSRSVSNGAGLATACNGGGGGDHGVTPSVVVVEAVPARPPLPPPPLQPSTAATTCVVCQQHSVVATTVTDGLVIGTVAADSTPCASPPLPSPTFLDGPSQSTALAFDDEEDDEEAGDILDLELELVGQGAGEGAGEAGGAGAGAGADGRIGKGGGTARRKVSPPRAFMPRIPSSRVGDGTNHDAPCARSQAPAMLNVPPSPSRSTTPSHHRESAPRGDSDDGQVTTTAVSNAPPSTSDAKKQSCDVAAALPSGSAPSSLGHASTGAAASTTAPTTATAIATATATAKATATATAFAAADAVAQAGAGSGSGASAGTVAPAPAQQRPTVVLKIGTSSLLSADGVDVRLSMMARVVESVVELKKAGFNVVLVSSGAVGAGCARMKLPTRPSSVAQKQALAALGQGHLMRLYDEFFSNMGFMCAQVLLTYSTFAERSQYVNARNAMLEMLEMGIVPIVNENDTVAVQELMVGDNDSMGALVANLVSADWYFIFTDVDAVYTGNPKEDPSARPIRVVTDIPEVRKVLGFGAKPPVLPESEAPEGAPNTSSSTADAGPAIEKKPIQSGRFGTGGMHTKLVAAQLAFAGGITTVILHSRAIEEVLPIINGAEIGTRFLPARQPIRGRKKWLLGLNPQGRLILDDGAVRAVCHNRKNLLSAGIIKVEGDFAVNEAVQLCDKSGNVFAIGLANYCSDDMAKIARRRSREMGSVLGYVGSQFALERENIVVLVRPTRKGARSPDAYLTGSPPAAPPTTMTGTAATASA